MPNLLIDTVLMFNPSPSLFSQAAPTLFQMRLAPACRTLDCVSVFTASCGDASLAKGVVEGFDEGDPYSWLSIARPLAGPAFQFGVLDEQSREFKGDAGAEALYDQAITNMCDLGGTPVTIDYTPFLQGS